MSNLADLIEQYLRRILTQQKMVELQRRELAKMFRCAPSQINYVLETRFTLERGFLIESRRGSGGYIRISEVQWKSGTNLPQLLEEIIPQTVESGILQDILESLVRKQLLPAETALLAQSLMEQDFDHLPPEYAGYLRSRFIKALLMILERENS